MSPKSLIHQASIVLLRVESFNFSKTAVVIETVPTLRNILVRITSLFVTPTTSAAKWQL